MPSRQIIHPSAVPWLAGGAILVGVGLLIGWWYQPYPELIATVFSENGPVETLEIAALTSAAALFLFRAARTDDPIGTMCIPIALVLAVALVRETPRCDSSFYDGGMCFPDQQWKNITVGLFLVAAAIALFIRRRHFFAVFSIQRIHVFWPIWISALLLISAEISEKYGVMGTEEVVEFFAYLYLACFGVWMHRNT